ncbi:MAG TPA: hypothetical protein ENI05_12715 [Porticoccus sp.]|nr:hypothetical protein [Porticoccus sp.]
MTHSDKRYIRTVERIAAEAFWLYTYQKALCGLTVDAIGLDFFRVSLNALKDARIIRLIRVLEDDSKVSSFWYLVRANEKLMKKTAKESAFNIQAAKILADKFIGIRNKTFVHIDKQRVFDPSELYKEASITHDEIDDFVNGLWRLMQRLHIALLGKEIEGDNYTGEDIRHLANLRDRELEGNA